VNAVAVGVSSLSNGANASSFGTAANANGDNSQAFGASASSNGVNTTAVGANATAIGTNAYASGANARAEGRNVVAIGTGAVAYGYNTNVVTIGTDGYANGTNAIALGSSSQAIGTNVDAFGAAANAQGLNALAMGSGAKAVGVNVIAIGAAANAFGTNATAIGPGATAGTYGSTAIGAGAYTWRRNQVVLGTSNNNYQLPGLGGVNGQFINDTYQNYGEKRFVTTDSQGTLGTTTFSVQQLIWSVQGIAASSAALSSTPQSTLLPDESIRCGMGSGFYGTVAAGALGCAIKAKDNVFFNGGLASSFGTGIWGTVQGKLGISIGWGGARSSKKEKAADAFDAQQKNTNGEPLILAAYKQEQEQLNQKQESEIDQLKARIKQLESELMIYITQAKDKQKATKQATADQTETIEGLRLLLSQKEKLEQKMQAILDKQQADIASQRLMLQQQQAQINQLLNLMQPPTAKQSPPQQPARPEQAAGPIQAVSLHR